MSDTDIFEEDAFRGTGNVVVTPDMNMAEDWEVLDGWPDRIFYLVTGGMLDPCCIWEAIPLTKLPDGWEMQCVKRVWVEKSFLPQPEELDPMDRGRITLGSTLNVYTKYLDKTLKDALNRHQKHREWVAKSLERQIQIHDEAVRKMNRERAILMARLAEVVDAYE